MTDTDRAKALRLLLQAVLAATNNKWKSRRAALYVSLGLSQENEIPVNRNSTADTLT